MVPEGRVSPILLPVRLRNPVDIRFRSGPYRVVVREHAADKILKFTRDLVVWHQPDSNSWQSRTARDAGATSLRQLRKVNADRSNLLGNSAPAICYLVVGIDDDANSRAAINSEFVRNGREDFLNATLRNDAELWHPRCTNAHLKDNVLVAVSLNQEDAAGRGTVLHRTSIPCSAAILRSFSEYSTAHVSPSRRLMRARAPSMPSHWFVA